ncbi:MAG: hypothetical protein P9M06_06420 [Candidatus Saelkia tenebricola]|nr:hypothetical protein [Candidatus Saelkia tenebricola]
MNIAWLKYKKNRRGRDPLGVQAINIHLYALLIPGITNVTQRLRYYSFFPWLLYNYNQQKPKVDFVSYLRRSEFLFGLITNYHHRHVNDWRPHMVGTNVINMALMSFSEEKVVDLKKYTGLLDSPERYWKFKTGGFGQIYLGPLSDLGVLMRKSAINYSLYSARGQDLAKSFQDGGLKEKFLSCVYEGKVTEKELQEFEKVFCVCSIDDNSEEYRLLADYMSGVDRELEGSTYRRRDSLALAFALLKHLEEPSDIWEMLNILYFGRNRKGKGFVVPTRLLDIAICWKYHVRHEYFSIGISGMFVGVQHLLSENRLTFENIAQNCWSKFLVQFDAKADTKKIVETQTKMIKNSTLEGFLDWIEKNYDASRVWDQKELNEYNLANDILNKSYPADEIFFKGFLLVLFSMIRAVNLNDDSLPGINLLLFFRQYPINLTALKKDCLNKWMKMPVFDVMADLLHRYVLNAHLDVAIRKLYSEGLATFRFLREDSDFSHSGMEIDTVSQTSPRLKKALQMLSDLNIVKESSGGFWVNNSQNGDAYFKDLIDGN